MQIAEHRSCTCGVTYMRRMKRRFLIPLPLLLASCYHGRADIGRPWAAGRASSASDQPAFAPIVKFDAIDAAALLKMLDEAGAERAEILSVGYSFADERKKLNSPELLTRHENDWTAQVTTAPLRLRGFCGVNPLAPGGLAEIEPMV